MVNFANRTLFHCDNLSVLRGIDSGCVHLIATDPPFNKNKDFHATPDSLAAGAKFEDRWRWDDDVHDDWVDAIKDDWSAVWSVIEASRQASGDDMGAYLCWLGIRLFEMHRVLRDDGSLYLHIDHTAHAWVKALLDAIFGRQNFRNEIIWCYSWPRNTRRYYGRMHDTILFYTKGGGWTFKPDDIRQPYSPESSGRDEHAANASAFGGAVVLDDRGKLPQDWVVIPPLRPNARERTGYPTQKPLALYERMIKASSNPGDIVLDPFAGCATTPVAAERLGRQWVAIDIWDAAHQTIINRLQQEGLAGPEGDTDRLLTFGQIHYSTAPPVRSDGNEAPVPMLKLRRQVAEPAGPRMSRAEMAEFLIEEHGIVCQGCDREFDDPRYLELDHNTPRADGGLNHVSNRVLLCGPCNRLKSNIFTLSGLRRENQKRGYMAAGRRV